MWWSIPDTTPKVRFCKLVKKDEETAKSRSVSGYRPKPGLATQFGSSMWV